MSEMDNDFASLTCLPCKRQKRKCDKRLPSCSLCTRTARLCEYSSSAVVTSPTPEAFAALSQQVRDLEAAVRRSSPQTLQNDTADVHSDSSLSWMTAQGSPAGFPQDANSFPSIFFLDSHVFGIETYKIRRPQSRVPDSVIQALGDTDGLRSIIARHFTAAHGWFPIVSQTRIWASLSSPSFRLEADMALLLLVMKTLQLGHTEDQADYNLAKSFMTSLDSQQIFSLQTMQAALLLSLYEIGHAMYPAAYLSVGHCSRLALAMGLDDKRTPQMLPGPTSWTEQEERRRIWWAVIVLDRIVSIGLLGRQVSINVNLDSVLPVDDNAWSRGEANVAQPLGLSASAQVKAAPFARTCQAAHLMGRIIDHVTDRRMTVESRYGEAFHLHQALTAFTAACSIDDRADQEYGILFYTAAAMCCSASLTLYEHYACPDNVPEGSPEAHLAMQKLSLEGLAAVSEQVLRLAVKLTAYVEVNGSASVSPFMLDAIYQAGANFVWYIREANDESKREQLNIIRRLLRLLEGKWHVAAEYLGIIHRFERRMSPS